jgi:hypothetical protein
MNQVKTIEDVYPAIEELIVELKSIGQSKLAEILHHRMYRVAWNTREELFEELHPILIDALQKYDVTFPNPIQNQMHQTVQVIGDHLKTY